MENPFVNYKKIIADTNAVVQEFYGQSMTEDEGFIAPDFFAMAREILNLRAERDEALKLVDENWVTHQQIIAALEKENLELKHQINELQLQVGDWKDAAEQTIAAARGTRLDAAGERQLRQLVASVIAYQKENAQLFEVNAQLVKKVINL